MNDEEEKEGASGGLKNPEPVKEEEKGPLPEEKSIETSRQGGQAAAHPAEDAAQPGKEEAVSVDELKAKHQEDLKELKEKMLRIAADFDNYKKRIQRDLKDREERTKADTLKIILPTIDNLQRAASNLKESTGVKTVLEGIGIIEKNFLDTMAKMGVRRFESLGHAFDPTLHEAVMQQESEEYPAGTVMAEVQAGFMLGERLLRAALVVVSSGKPKQREAAEKNEDEGKNEAAADAPGDDGGDGGPVLA